MNNRTSRAMAVEVVFEDLDDKISLPNFRPAS